MKFLYFFFIVTSCIFSNVDDRHTLLEDFKKEPITESNANKIAIKEARRYEYDKKFIDSFEKLEKARCIFEKKIQPYQEHILMKVYNKAVNTIMLNFSFALTLERTPDETITLMLVQIFEKLDKGSASSFKRFDEILSAFYQRTILLMAILQNDYAFPEKFKGEIFLALQSNDPMLFSGMIFGKPLFFYLFCCKKLPLRIIQKLDFLKEQIKNPSEQYKAIHFHLKVSQFFAEFLPPTIGPLTKNQQMLMPFFNTCAEIYKLFIQEKHKNFILTT